jgi:hypothetical protein
MSLCDAVGCLAVLFGVKTLFNLTRLSDDIALLRRRLSDPATWRDLKLLTILKSEKAKMVQEERRKDEEDKAKCGKIKQDRRERKKQRKAMANGTAAPETAVKMGLLQRLLSYLPSFTMSAPRPHAQKATPAKKTGKVIDTKAEQRSWVMHCLVTVLPVVSRVQDTSIVMCAWAVGKRI